MASPSDQFTDDVTAIMDLQAQVAGLFTNPTEAAWQQRQLLLFEISYCFLVDRYLTFLVDALTELYRNRPEMLKSNETVTFEFILNHESMDQLRNSLIERRVLSLAFLGMAKLAEYFAKNLQLPLFQSETDLATGIAAIEIRNLFVHHRGIVNDLFRKRVPSMDCEVGKKLVLVNNDLAMNHSVTLMKSAGTLMVKAREKFGVTI